MASRVPNILCPVDFSDKARTALARALSLADHFKARLSVLHISARADDAADPGLWEALDRFVMPAINSLERLYPRPVMVVRGGVPGEVIVDLSRREHMDFVVMATHGRGRNGGTGGSTAQYVLHHSPVPVLIVPPALQGPAKVEAERLLSGARTILSAIDLHPRAAFDARVAAALAEAFALPLLLLHVLEHEGRAEAREAVLSIEELARDAAPGVSTEVLISHGSVAEEISRVADERGAGLIVMGLRGRREQADSEPGALAFDVLRRAQALVLGLPLAAVGVAAQAESRPF